MSTNPVLEQLGYAPDARLVILHADDVGMCHGSNKAFLELAAAGMLKTGSIMMPCAWSPEILAATRANPTLDLGVHLTLNCEWSVYRWGPMSTRDHASGLIDAEGWFWHRPHMLMEHIVPAAAVREMETQIEWCARAGVGFTHLDAHMGAAHSAPLLRSYVELGFRHGVPVLLPRDVDEYTRSLAVHSVGIEEYSALVAAVEQRGMPLVDTFRITPGYDAHFSEGGQAEQYETILRELPAGITYFSLHPNAPGDIELLTPLKAHWRTFEYEYFQSQRLRDFLQAEGIISIGYRELCQLMRA